MADSQVYTATSLSVLISKALGRTVSPKQVRGRVRGDSGAPLLERYSAGHKDAAYASHVYTAREADAIGASFVKAHNARTGANKTWTSVAKRTSKPTTKRGPSASRAKPSAPSAAIATASASQTPTS